ncbi:MAG: Rne/Rng family ribonuclease [Deltaproteobacteria bacterium]|nr:Rne/Rng family ribonuclease [Deltaproteobacteria bacterium]MBW2121637.1 Rne/Rng family ribonuclease [Deltaproteobacteria bacterium]
MLINAAQTGECRVAIVEGENLVDFNIETTVREKSKGNIYSGIVTHIEPSFQAAFVDYGAKRHGFLSLSEVNPQYYEKQVPPGERPRIQDVLSRGQKLIVQVVKEEMSNKGAALTTNISLPGRYVVLMPGTESYGVSRKIEDERQRERLLNILKEFNHPEGIGFIVRTAGADKSKRELFRECGYLVRLWESIQAKMRELPVPSLLYQESHLMIQSIREYFTKDMEVLVDDKEVYRQIKDFFRQVMPQYQRRVKLYQEKKPLFARFNLEEQIEAIYARKVPLKSGGSICIDPTEALVSIDVNSGRLGKSKSIEQTALNTNLEAAEEIARQLRLRDLGGLIVIDFIDMKDRKHNLAVERCLRNALKKDKAKTDVSKISKFGLLEMSRQRLKTPLAEESYTVCLYCDGRGRVKSTESLSLTVLRKILDRVIEGDVGIVKGIFSRPVASYLLNQKRKELSDIEKEFHLHIWFTGQWEMAPDQYVLEFVTRDKLEGLEEKELEKESRPVPSEQPPLPSLPRLIEEEMKKPWYRKIFGRF